MLMNSCACCARYDFFAAPADAPGSGASAPATGGTIERSYLEDIAIASRICAAENVFDAFGHLSVRHPANKNRFLMSRSKAPALTTADDIMEFDLDCNACDQRGRGVFLERFIHGEIYKVRADVNSIVHSHSASVVPFSLVPNKMRAMFHTSAFIAQGVPVFDIRAKYGATDMLVGDNDKGRELARVLADKSVVLMRAHGSVAVGPSLQHAVYRAVYTEVNAKLQMSATLLGGEIAALDEEEGRLADAVNIAGVGRPWDLWKMKMSGAA